ncbi:MAG: HDOD domain-containing protein [Planctomycetota bacterium]
MVHDAERTHARARQVELILKQIDALPTLGPVAARLLTVASAEDADLDEIVRMIESDPALTGRILSLCARADKGVPRNITTVRRAVVMLGLDAVRAAALSVTVYELMRGSERRLEEAPESETDAPFDRAGFWRFCVTTASAAERLAKEHPALKVQPDEAFSAGLLSGLGKLALDLILPRSYAKVLGVCQQRLSDAAPVERTLLGLDNHTAAKRLSEHWGLPGPLRDVLWLHGQPMSSVPELPHRNLIAVVNTARASARELHLGFSGDFGQAPASETVAEECGLDPARVREALPEVPEEVAERCALLGLEANHTGELLVDAVAQANRALGRVVRALESKARASRQQAGVLGAIESFHAGLRRAGAGRSVVGVLGEIVGSARGLLGDGFYATLFQAVPGEDWQLHRFGPEGELIQAQPVEPPPDAHGSNQDLASLTSAEELSVAAMTALPWLADHMHAASDVRAIRFMALTSPEPERQGPAGVLVHDRDLPKLGFNAKRLAALTTTWAAAIDSAHGHEQSRDLGEQLADRNRALAEAQHRLTENESLARLGEMTAGAAHEMNNPLTVISGRSQVLAIQLEGTEHGAAADKVHQAAQDLSELITALHVIAIPPEPNEKNEALRPLIEQAAKIAELRCGLGLAVQLEGADGWGGVRADRELLPQALVELIVNAAEADPTGPVTVRVEPLGGGGRVAVEVSDNGPGMSPKALKHAFDPFFSEKPAGRQRGLGLPKAKRLIELQGGSIALVPMTGGGTLARVVLPSAALEPNDETTLDQTPSTSRGAAA